MRVLLVNDRPIGPGSGTEVHVDRLRTLLTSAGHEVEVFAGQIAHHGAAKVLDVWDPMARRALGRVAERFRPDVVHHHNVVRELSVSVLGVPTGAATVLTAHDHRLLQAHEGPASSSRFHPVLLAKDAKAVLDRAVVRRRVDVVVAVSAELEGRLRHAGIDRVRTVPNFAPAAGAGVPPLGDDVVFAGRLSAEKGVDVLIEAFADVAGDHPASTLVVAGDGPERAALEALAQRRAPGRVRFTGTVPEATVHELMNRARLVAAPSTRVTEGAPLVVIEALVAGRPVVGTDSPAFRELIGADERGVLVPIGDAAALREALDRLLRDRPLAERLGRAAHEHGHRHHTPAAALSAFEDVYAEALARHG